MTAQLDLEFRAEPPEVTPSEVAELIARLRGYGWQTCRDLGAKTEKERRKIRAVAEAADRLVISGAKGYKLTLEATPEEIGKFRWMLSQGRKMTRRYIRTARYWHEAVGSQVPA